jgi:hypothetical protein
MRAAHRRYSRGRWSLIFFSTVHGILLAIPLILNAHGRIALIPAQVFVARASLVAFFLTEFQSERHNWTENFMKRSVIPPALLFERWWVNWTRENDSRRHLLFPPDEFRELQTIPQSRPRNATLMKDRDLAAKFFFSLRFFLQNTSGRWFYRATDDSLINFARLGPFLSQLELEHNPLTEFVFLSNCVADRRGSFPQGGSGYLISRSGAQVLEPLARRFMRTLVGPEDVSFRWFLNSLNESIASTASPFFCGHGFGLHSVVWIWRDEWWQLPDCNRSQVWNQSIRGCPPFLSRVRDIVFYHEFRRQSWQSHGIARVLFKAPPRIM